MKYHTQERKQGEGLALDKIKSIQNQISHGMWGGIRNCKHKTANKILASILTMVGMAG